MENEFIGVIRPFCGPYAPMYWMPCIGQLVSVQQYQALFSLIGNVFGGDGRTTFGIPDLRSVVPVGFDVTTNWSKVSGSSTVSLSYAQIPNHSHQVLINTVNSPGTTTNPANNLIAQSDVSYAGEPFTSSLFSSGPANTTLMPNTVNNISSYTGGTAAHNNMQPYLGVYFIICYNGIYPVNNT